MGLFYLFGHVKTRRNKQLKNLEANCVKIKGPNVLASKASRLASSARGPADEAIPPTDEASSIGPYIFFLNHFYLFSNVFFLSAAGILPLESALISAFSELSL